MSCKCSCLARRLQRQLNTKRTNTAIAASVASTTGSMVEASGYKFSEKDMKPGKVKLKKTPKGKNKKSEGAFQLSAPLTPDVPNSEAND